MNRFFDRHAALVVVTIAVPFGGCGRVGFDLVAYTGSSSENSDASGAGGADDSDGAANTGGATGTGGAAGAGGTTGRGGTTGTGGTQGTGATLGIDAGPDGCALTSGGVETCDGLDNDCNGSADDGTVCGSQCIGATYGGHAYAYCAAALDFPSAANDCQTKSMRLVRVDDDLENQFVASIAFAGYAPGVNAPSMWPWLGGADRATPVEWFWSDGAVFWSGRSNGSPVGSLYSNWGSANPGDTAGTRCATMERTSDIAWVDRVCDELHPYVCEAY